MRSRTLKAANNILQYYKLIKITDNRHQLIDILTFSAKDPAITPVHFSIIYDLIISKLKE